MSIRIKILIACLLLTAITVAFGLYSQESQRDLAGRATKMYDQVLMSVSFAHASKGYFWEMVLIFGEVARGDAPDDAADTLESLGEDISDSVAVAVERGASKKSRALAASLEQSAAELTKMVLTHLEDPDKVTVASVESQIEAVGDQFDSLIDQQTEEGFVFREATEAAIIAGEKLTWLMMCLAVFSALLITFVLSRTIIPALVDAVVIAGRIADGQLENQISNGGSGETGALMKALRRMQGSIADNLRNVEAMREQQKAEADQRHQFVQDELARLCATLEQDMELAVGDILQQSGN